MTASLVYECDNAFLDYGAEKCPTDIVRDRDEWVMRAQCRHVDPDALFVQGAEQRKAVYICQGCPVMSICRADALDNRVEFGVWGGLTERQRRAILRKNPEITSWADYFAAGGDLPGW
ncbi:Transcriptional regulator WhiB4 [Corynebacterium lowii]|uniref:Transcriptional regulator WhiB n=2 Tax=Corynebacterium lowii TaxID=1544413 RepID=A0A0Q0ULJ6_9CORY|nr:Transcriptional regulator WhiB4 [Corynebacterium lowii]MDP9852196.1 WhiB family redox-sensing transcriptional regulator [Corynebacterium lowii]